MSVGDPGVTVASSQLGLTAYPMHGFHIGAIVDRASGRNLLWQRDGDVQNAPLELGPLGQGSIATFDQQLFFGGWFLMFPSTGLPGPEDPDPKWMHGEVARRHWEVSAHTADSITARVTTLDSAFEVRRTIAVDDSTITIATEVTNLTDTILSYSIGEHPCFSRDTFAGGRIALAASSARSVNPPAQPSASIFTAGQHFTWPHVPTAGVLKDAAEIPTSPDGRHDHLEFTMREPQVSISSPKLGKSALLCDLGTGMPYTLIWQHYAPAGSSLDADTFAVEFSSAPGRTTDDARAAGLRELAAQSTMTQTTQLSWIATQPRPAATP